ncbi:MAG: hypothetical protein R3E96_05660 [Planctomycetota bacterium]
MKPTTLPSGRFGVLVFAGRRGGFSPAQPRALLSTWSRARAGSSYSATGSDSTSITSTGLSRRAAGSTGVSTSTGSWLTHAPRQRGGEGVGFDLMDRWGFSTGA